MINIIFNENVGEQISLLDWVKYKIYNSLFKKALAW